MPDHHEYCTDGFSPDDVVISGVAGRFPECNSVGELKEALFTQKNILLEKNTRFKKGTLDLPFGSCGTVTDIDKFDRDFFGFSVAGANFADPLQRMILEVSYEAMVDAGYEPTNELRGSKTGVYAAVSNDDSKFMLLMEKEFSPSAAPGILRCMLANRISHIFDFHGPSYTVDSACSSSFVALCCAYDDIREGRVDAALVNAGQLCLAPIAHLIYYGAGMISPTNESNPFDAREWYSLDLNLLTSTLQSR